MLLGKQAVEVVRIGSVVQIGPKDGVLPGHVKPFDDHRFDRRGASYCIEIAIEAVFHFVEGHPSPRHVAVFHLPQMHMGALHRCPIGIMISEPVHQLSIIDPISEWHRSHDEVALSYPEAPHVSGHHVLQCCIDHRLPPVPYDGLSVMAL
jgi:hypothetical protein